MYLDRDIVDCSRLPLLQPFNARQEIKQFAVVRHGDNSAFAVSVHQGELRPVDILAADDVLSTTVAHQVYDAIAELLRNVLERRVRELDALNRISSGIIEHQHKLASERPIIIDDLSSSASMSI